MPLLKFKLIFLEDSLFSTISKKNLKIKSYDLKIFLNPWSTFYMLIYDEEPSFVRKSIIDLFTKLKKLKRTLKKFDAKQKGAWWIIVIVQLASGCFGQRTWIHYLKYVHHVHFLRGCPNELH